jgi:hypothetical protein
LTSVILAFAPAIAAKVKSIFPPAEEAIDLELFEARARIAELEGQVAELRLALERERHVSHHMRREAHYQMLAAHEHVARHQAQQYNAGLAQMHQAQAMESPYQQSALGLAQMNAQHWPNGALGAQNLLGAWEDVCNCVPARHDLLLPPR